MYKTVSFLTKKKDFFATKIIIEKIVRQRNHRKKYDK